MSPEKLCGCDIFDMQVDGDDPFLLLGKTTRNAAIMQEPGQRSSPGSHALLPCGGTSDLIVD